MTREIFKEQLLKKIEQQIFNELKDTPITGSKYILNKWNGLDIDYSAVYMPTYSDKHLSRTLHIGANYINCLSANGGSVDVITAGCPGAPFGFCL